MKKRRNRKPSRAANRNSAAYWRSLYDQLKSDFDELLSINWVLVNRNAALEGRKFVQYNPPRHNIVIFPTKIPHRAPRANKDSSSCDESGIFNF